MKKSALVVAALGLGLVATTLTPPEGTRIFTQAAPPNPTPLRVLGRSHLSLVADLFWIRTIGVAVNLRVPADGLSLVNWCQLVTDLDPTFIYPYLFGGLLGPMSSAMGEHNLAEAGALLRKGMRNIPSDHRLALYLSFNQLHLEHDIKGAAQTLREGSKAPGAPIYMAQLATRLLSQTNDFDAAAAFAAELETSSPDPAVREMFARRRLEIERDRALETLQQAVDRYRAQRGTLPQSFLQLLAEGFITELPVDPLGGDFQLTPDGRVEAPSGSRLRAYFQEQKP